MTNSLPQDADTDLLDAIGECESPHLDAEDVIDLVREDVLISISPAGEGTQSTSQDSDTPTHQGKGSGNLTAAESRAYARQVIARWELNELLRQ